MGHALRATVLLALGCSLALAGCGRFEPGRTAPRGPQAVGGLLDLRAWDFAADGDLALTGEWEFASGALLDVSGAAKFGPWQKRVVPDFWTSPETGEREEPGARRGTGAGTYRLRVLLPAGAPRLAIRNRTGMNAFELEVNGETVASAGKPSLSRAEAVSSYSPGVASIDSQEPTLDILVRVSNYEYRGGGIWRAFVLGERSSLTSVQQAAIYASIALTVVVATLSVNSLILFSFRRKEKSFLSFAVFGFVIAIRPLVTGEYALTRIFPGIPFDLLIRIEYMTAMFAVPAAIVFFLNFFPTRRRRFWTLALILPFAPFALFELILPLYWLTWSIFAFYGVAIAVMVVAIVVVLARAAYASAPGGRAMFVGGVLVALCGINDILYSSHVIQTGNALAPSLAFFVFLQSVVLAQRFTSAFDEVELLSEELGESNAMLKDRIQSEMAASARLEESLAEKEVLLKEVHHRVKNSLQIVSSIASLQANRSSDPEVEAMSRSIKERIRVISLANERLYDLESGDKIDLCEYARDIVRLAVSSYDAEGCRIEGSVEGARVEAESAAGIDFGLILTELVMNAIKHAILPLGGGTVVVRIRQEGSAVRFEVGDEGPGFPDGFDPDKIDSLGFKIVQSLLKRRDGEISVSKGPHAVLTCTMGISR